ncbi:hypothetical protein PROFUN_10989 [Planoprotostelium fungivorum]|uniref:Uncharacterized protein n=1 Tax=Planoprotostelium fungivorum TaxID=1890364 RepID=A0A2P6NBX1_9EUKA|nr:hypothetical protein PROFUN_10989 [Planoprotostelium fungivorum]
MTSTARGSTKDMQDDSLTEESRLELLHAREKALLEVLSIQDEEIGRTSDANRRKLMMRLIIQHLALLTRLRWRAKLLSMMTEQHLHNRQIMWLTKQVESEIPNKMKSIEERLDQQDRRIRSLQSEQKAETGKILQKTKDTDRALDIKQLRDLFKIDFGEVILRKIAGGCVDFDQRVESLHAAMTNTRDVMLLGSSRLRRGAERLEVEQRSAEEMFVDIEGKRRGLMDKEEKLRAEMQMIETERNQELKEEEIEEMIWKEEEETAREEQTRQQQQINGLITELTSKLAQNRSLSSQMVQGEQSLQSELSALEEKSRVSLHLLEHVTKEKADLSLSSQQKISDAKFTHRRQLEQMLASKNKEVERDLHELELLAISKEREVIHRSPCIAADPRDQLETMRDEQARMKRDIESLRSPHTFRSSTTTSQKQSTFRGELPPQTTKRPIDQRVDEETPTATVRTIRSVPANSEHRIKRLLELSSNLLNQDGELN